MYVDGRPVVDLWGGLADRESSRPWADDTIVLVFSSTKGVTATAANLLVERGDLDLDAPVAQYWPEFAAAGKDAVPVRYLLSHRVGLPVVDGEFTIGDVLAWDPVVDALASQSPRWEPGTAHGYHMRTYGWLVGELVRRVSGRTIGRFVADEVAAPLGVDFWIGLPEEQEPRSATLVPAGPSDLVELLPEGTLLRRGDPQPRRALRLRRALEHPTVPRGGAAVVERHRRRPLAGPDVRVAHRRGRRNAPAHPRHRERGSDTSRRAAPTRPS